ncbi:hypothetical protein Calkro_1579 [Caldicellulosiruptor kronotskyensis 2002]|uniref:Uncharacterized protein n=1 Tax=Caldicellulosiruptor kronotskyensis (strain DSM 18902 / VKM B-2412 / 2002) TaxID=632348 RepID=E4SFA6_CALK2|nr:hypothetical protein [Caldicellulosiruptor kronotskyensis]ADQ46431.1 hypothetical protein Calkro_1579 [Caldicellulosiruptor kronotskyensis 2002]
MAEVFCPFYGGYVYRQGDYYKCHNPKNVKYENNSKVAYLLKGHIAMCTTEEYLNCPFYQAYVDSLNQEKNK